MNLDWKCIKEEDLVKDEWMHFKKKDYLFPDGKVYGPFYTYSIRSYVTVVAQDEQGNFLCVRQFRQGIGRQTIEFPAGGIESKEMNQEIALQAAKRELLEETGYQSEDWTYLYNVPSHATLADNEVYIFFARNCHKEKEQALDQTEFLSYSLLSSKEVEALIQEEKFEQALHILAWFLWKQKESTCE